jgi:squalene-hopene cyclase-like protein/prenyltransferase/squalene oxidase-like repeat protein
MTRASNRSERRKRRTAEGSPVRLVRHTLGRREFVLSGLVACVNLGRLARAVADPKDSTKQDHSPRDHVTPQTQQAIDKGLAWLAARQHADGAFGSGSGFGRNVAVTALSGIAFLASGSTPGRGPYGEQVNRATEFIVSVTKPNGFIHVKEQESYGPMYGHGFATLYLAEVYGMSKRADVREKLERAVRLIVQTQNPEGGWRYQPEPKEADISATVCQIMALRAARNAGLHVPNETVDRCIDYVKKCQNPDGGFRYQLVRHSESAFPRSAAGIVALHSAGLYEGKEIERGLGYLLRYTPRGQMARYEGHFFYGHYYAAQAMWRAGGEHWDQWYPAIRDTLLRDQLPDGAWTDSTVCIEYGTAMALIILQLPNNYLPIFQR